MREIPKLAVVYFSLCHTRYLIGADGSQYAVRNFIPFGSSVLFTVTVRYANFRHTLRDLYSTPTKTANSVSEKSPFSRGVIGQELIRCLVIMPWQDRRWPVPMVPQASDRLTAFI